MYIISRCTTYQRHIIWYLVDENAPLLGCPKVRFKDPYYFSFTWTTYQTRLVFFRFIFYADDTTLITTINNPSTGPLNINGQLTNVYDWLAVNKLSLNIKKTKYILFHAINKHMNNFVAEPKINDICIEKVNYFNFLGLYLNENSSWKTHIDIVANKLKKFSGVLNKLKKYLPSYTLRTLYCSMVQSRPTYYISAWGFNCQRLEKIQKRFMRIISLSKYNAHTEPLFKALELLNL